MKKESCTITVSGLMPKPDTTPFLFFPFWLIFLVLWMGSLKAQPPVTQAPTPKEFPVRVAIKLVDMATQKPVPFASVRLLGTTKGCIADSNGFFTFVITQKDTLKINSLGYHEVLYTKNPLRQTNYYEAVPMRSKIFELNAVQILARRNKNLDHPMVRWEYKAKFQPKLWLFYTPTGEPPPDPDVSSPISFLYNKYSRRGKANRKLRDMVAERARKKRLAVRYNALKVQSWTGLEDHEIDAFMQFCPMPEAFIEQASELEIIERTFRCLEEFDNRETDK
jgi:hypothetical protein